MKREELKEMKGRLHAIGKVKKFSLANIEGEKIVTMLLLDIKVHNEENEAFLDHAWVRVGPKTYDKELREGSVIEFTCLKKEYYHAPDYTEIQGYGIRKIRNIKVFRKGKGQSMEQFVFKAKNKRKLMKHLL